MLSADCLPSDGRIISSRNTTEGAIMNSFTVTAVGNLAKDPEVHVKGDTTYTKICLVGNDYAGKDEHGNAREAVTSLWFVAFESLGEAIAKNVRKGDQLILQAQIRSNNWTDKEGEKQYDYSFVVQTFRFGAPGKIKREELAARRDEREGALETEI
jgi:single-strand DNA-binding protein